jgi:L-arabinokinase
LTVRGPFTFSEVDTDTGVVQFDALAPDLEATLERAQAFYSNIDERIAGEARALRACRASLVVADVPPLAFAAAEAAAIPSVAITNFTWDWIYEDYASALGRTSELPQRIRACHACARGAWRLPMHGGFAGFRLVRDLPLVARRSRRPRHELREALGLADRPALLVSFGGVGMRRLPLETVAQSGGATVVTTREPDESAAATHSLAETTSSGVVVLDERRLYGDGWRYEDLVAAVDVVVTKPGYGIIAECIANGTAMLYTSRGRFAEYDVLVEAMPRAMRCAYIPQDDLLSGYWQPQVARLLKQPRPEAPAVNGAEVAAGWIDELLRGRP